ncbi:lipase family protein [Rhodococcus yananensis]|uniref:lipase family protein n=1 Tax=Rhodococcus yananensis TaxID=2879464 RepID=UPI001CF8C102|nr:lipase family protein [Rhodococcus yananensis]
MAVGRARKWGVSAALSAALVGGALTAPAVAHAEGDFYQPPAVLDGESGDLIRTEPSTVPLSIPTGDGQFPAQGTRLLYRSLDANGAPNAVSGTYLEPSVPWNGPGERPLVVVAPGTQGQGDQCAPSKVLNSIVQYTPPLDVFSEYEIISIDAMLLQGMAVVVTDYDGLGTPGHHTYVNRLAEAHAVLDAARAAQALPDTSIPADGPVGLFGYSQGGGAVAAAAELAPSYAPELDLQGVYAGAPPADLLETLKQIDGTALTGAIGYTINGLSEAYPQVHDIIDSEVTDKGRDMLGAVANQCLLETMVTFGFQRTSEYTRTGESLDAVVARTPEIFELLDAQRIGRVKPEVPVLVQHGTQDDIVPFGQGRQLAVDWCALGATVQFSSNTTPPILPGLAVNHALPMIAGLPESVSYMNDRFAGVPAPSNCGAF